MVRVWPLRRHLKEKDRAVVHAFQRLLHRGWNHHPRHWMGQYIIKYPQDLFLYQEVLYAHRPEVVVETGTHKGGSALFFCTMCDLLGQGAVVTVDTRHLPGRAAHPRLTCLVGDSTDPAMVAQIRDLVGARTCMVVLDSNHASKHVARELAAYSPMVTPGQFLVVEDMELGTVVPWNRGTDSPARAVEAFLSQTDDFEVVPLEQKFLIGQNEGGWLRRREVK